MLFQSVRYVFGRMTAEEGKTSASGISKRTRISIFIFQTTMLLNPLIIWFTVLSYFTMVGNSGMHQCSMGWQWRWLLYFQCIRNVARESWMPIDLLLKRKGWIPGHSGLNYPNINWSIGCRIVSILVAHSFGRQHTESKKRCHGRCSNPTAVDRNDFIEVEIPKLRIQPPRLCNGDLQKFQKHMDSMRKSTNRGKYKVCGKPSSWKCGLCNKWIHCRGNEYKDIACMLNYHNEKFFGPARSDCKWFTVNKSKKEWTVPSKVKRRENERHIKQLLHFDDGINNIT